MTTLSQSVIDKAARLFERSAKAWERGNNSGDSAYLAKCCEQERRLAQQGAALLDSLANAVNVVTP